MSSLGKFPGYLGRECHPEPGKTLERLATCGEDGSLGLRLALGVPAGTLGPFSSQHSYAVSAGAFRRRCQLNGDYLPRFRGSNKKERKV